LFDPFDGARAITDIVVGGLLDSQRLERLETIRQETPGGKGLSADEVITALVNQAFPAQAVASPLQGVVETETAEALMNLAADQNAPMPVAAAAWSGFEQLQRAL